MSKRWLVLWVIMWGLVDAAALMIVVGLGYRIFGGVTNSPLFVPFVVFWIHASTVLFVISKGATHDP